MTVREGHAVHADATLADLDEQQILARIVPLSRVTEPQELLGPGDDTALLAVRSGSALVTTDAMVLGRDWVDEWSSASDVGMKCAAQNLADIAAMGGVTTGIVMTLVADPGTPFDWVRDLSSAITQVCAEQHVAVLGGDLSSAPAGVRMVSITAMGELTGPPVLRSGAQVGDVVAVSDGLGRSGAGLLLLQRESAARDSELVRFHLCPQVDYSQGPTAATAGATSMIDISDGLVRDAGRIATASGVHVELTTAALQADVDSLQPEVGSDALDCVLHGGEEHTLLATFPAKATLPPGWRRIGVVEPGAGVSVDGTPVRPGGWDHFSA